MFFIQIILLLNKFIIIKFVKKIVENSIKMKNFNFLKNILYMKDYIKNLQNIDLRLSLLK